MKGITQFEIETKIAHIERKLSILKELEINKFVEVYNNELSILKKQLKSIANEITKSKH